MKTAKHFKIKAGLNTPRTDCMSRSVKGMSEFARARNFAYLCRKLERELIQVGMALNTQNERWGLYTNDSQNALRAFNNNNPPKK